MQQNVDMNLDTILIEQSEKLGKIIVLTMSGGGFEHGSTREHLYMFDTETELEKWAHEFCQDQDEANNEEDPWVFSEEKITKKTYKICSWTNCNPDESGWEVQTTIKVYYPSIKADMDAENRHPRKAFTQYKAYSTVANESADDSDYITEDSDDSEES